jgi:hypothetical protein
MLEHIGRSQLDVCLALSEVHNMSVGLIQTVWQEDWAGAEEYIDLMSMRLKAIKKEMRKP